jgi:hypothetical protein
MQSFVDSNDYILSVQIYELLKNNEKHTYHYEIVPTGIRYVTYGQTINDIHEIYEVDKRKIDQYRKFTSNYLKSKDQSKYINYIKKLNDRLQKVANGSISDSNLLDYCCFGMALRNLFVDEAESFNIDNINENEIKKYKRNGFLEGIIEENFNVFEYSGDNPDKKRLYITKILPIENKQHMFVISIDSNIKNLNDYFDKLNSISDKFYDILDKKLSLVYNEYMVD